MDDHKAKPMPYVPDHRQPLVKKVSIEMTAVDSVAIRFLHACQRKGIVDLCAIKESNGIWSGMFLDVLEETLNLAIHANALNPDEKNIVAFKETFEKVLGVKPQL